ncbi:MAG: FAD-linked oxidase C-terminal domain-containing protein [Gemmatimonadota bacterium]|nr:FAD-linked oxidase C-terminal domain-containing protein [Gemmatimonadota bacterium]
MAQRLRPRLDARLRSALSGEVRTDDVTRGLYATDASIYRITPLAVAFPRSGQEIRRAVEIAGELGTSVVPRGAGTSQSGQAIGPGLILDTSRHLDAVLDFEPEARRIVVRPGLVLDALNRFLEPHGLFFPVDVATSSRATLGGMAGNNSAGARSVRYGHMVEHVRGIEAVLSDATRAWFGRESGARHTGGRPAAPGVPRALRDDLAALYAREADELARRIPDVPRHVAGYALHRLGRTEPRLSDLLVGSEGTLAFFTALELELEPIPARRTLGVCRFATVRDALEAVPALVALEPTAVELIDGTLLELASRNPSFQATLARLGARFGDARSGDGLPGALLVVEFAGDDAGAIDRSLSRLDDALPEGAVRPLRAESEAWQERIWGLRKAGLNIAMSMPEARKPLAFIEDCAIPLDRLPEWHDRLEGLIAEHGTRAIWYAHASVGCLHVRPALDLDDPEDRARLRSIAEGTFALARELGGSHSGEHGDGIIRSEFLEPVLGSRLARAFEAVKDRFDPAGRLNPGKVVRAPRMDDPGLLRPALRGRVGALPTVLDWSRWGGLAGAIDMCNNNGTCRKRQPGVMCPTYRATRDERHATRGRANALRLALEGALGDDPWRSPGLQEAMDLCIGCKGCRRECPTGVDMARMKIEYLARRREREPPGLRDRAFAWLPRAAPWIARAPALANARNRFPPLARLGERLLGIAADRPLPRWAPRPFRWSERDPAGTPGAGDEPDRGARGNLHRGEAVLFVDTFTRYFEPGNARAALRVLEATGYRPIPAPGRGRPLCCGRTFLNAGLLDEARVELDRTVQALAPLARRGVPIVGLEPSCLLTLRDELGALRDDEDAEVVAERARLLPELLVADDALDDVLLAPLPVRRARVHGHCHEKALGLEEATLDTLAAIPDLEISAIAAGCCGMAGSFGYEREHVELSRRIAELELLPAVRGLRSDAWLVANGTSCRHQVSDLAGRRARHVAVVLDAALAPSHPER